MLRDAQDFLKQLDPKVATPLTVFAAKGYLTQGLPVALPCVTYHYAFIQEVQYNAHTGTRGGTIAYAHAHTHTCNTHSCIHTHIHTQTQTHTHNSLQ